MIQGVKNMTTSKTHTKRILTTQEVIDALRRNETVSVTDNILRIQKVFKNNPFMFCNFSNAKHFCFDSIDASYFRCHGVGILSVKEDIKDNFVVFGPAKTCWKYISPLIKKLWTIFTTLLPWEKLQK